MKKYDSIKLWDLKNYNSDLNIILSTTGRNYIKKKILARYGLLKNAPQKIGINYWTLVNNLRGRCAIDFARLIRLVTKLNLSRDIIQRQVEGLAIRSVKIKNVRFPIQCDPVFTSLFTNLLGDCGARCGSGSGYAHYNDPESHQLIQEKLLHVIGVTPYQDGMSIPRVLVYIMLKHFKINNVSTKKGRFPTKILEADKLTKLASLSAFINDEGTVSTSFIQIYSSNYKLLNSIKNLSRSLGYRVSKISRRKDKEIYLFRIKSIKEFNRDYKTLVEKYPEVRLLSRKERSLRILDLVAQRPKGIRNTNEIFNLIAPNLKNGPKTIYDLCEMTQSTQTALWRHLRELIKTGLIRREFSNLKTRYIYTLP